jgi:hypothetical protein
VSTLSVLSTQYWVTEAPLYSVPMSAPRALVGLLACLTLALVGCQELLSAEATPVPGAAATLARSSRTPIPTPVRTASPGAPAAVASPSRSPAPSPSAQLASAAAEEARVDRVRQALSESLAAPDLPGIEELMIDRVSLSTTEGGQVLDRDAAAAWLREHAGPGLQIGQLDRSSLSALLEIQTHGWPNKPPIANGQVTFNLHKYDPNGTQDEDRGDWRIDVIGAE